jgi:hypothetical protein
MSHTIASIEAMIASELVRVTELSTGLGAVLTATTRSGFARIIAAIDAAAAAEPANAVELATVRETAVTMMNFDPLSAVNDNER